MSESTFCPLIRKNCIKTKCAWYGEISFVDSESGEQHRHRECVITMVPRLILENSKQQRETTTSIENFRNESQKSDETLTKVLVHSINQQAKLGGVQEAEIKLLPPENE